MKGRRRFMSNTKGRVRICGTTPRRCSGPVRSRISSTAPGLSIRLESESQVTGRSLAPTRNVSRFSSSAESAA
jgi:hypothetical protein